MIAIDTSAVTAIFQREPEAERFEAIVRAQRRILVGTPTLIEFRMVARGRFDPVAVQAAEDWLSGAPFEIVDFGIDHVAAARSAFDRFGKGRHRASLNFGDCMAYAVARVADCPLLFKGDDFSRTDIASAV